MPLETLEPPAYYVGDADYFNGQLCRVCGMRLREGEEGGLCVRERCNDNPPMIVEGFAPTATFGGNGPRD